MNEQRQIETFIANLAHAVRNNEKVKIGGGIFKPEELAVVLAFLKSKLEN